MLIVSRRPGETVTIYVDGIKRCEVIMLDQRSGGRGRLGFEGDQRVTFVRTEIVDALREEGDLLPRRLEGLTDG
jgi:sRNA-binding carbon storage regulator CsrA